MAAAVTEGQRLRGHGERGWAGGCWACSAVKPLQLLHAGLWAPVRVDQSQSCSWPKA